MPSKSGPPLAGSHERTTSSSTSSPILPPVLPSLNPWRQAGIFLLIVLIRGIFYPKSILKRKNPMAGSCLVQTCYLTRENVWALFRLPLTDWRGVELGLDRVLQGIFLLKICS